MQEYKLHDPNQPPKRPMLLSVLCVITFVTSGFTTIIYFFSLLSYSTIRELLQSGEVSMPGAELFLSLPSSFFLLGTIFYAGSVFGAAFMWNLKKIGFHVYTASQIGVLITISSYNTMNGVPIFEILLTLMFIILYGVHLRLMK
ncbi:MAG: hypothetical protein K9G67_00605 [Bacteroidales bacterium]|nr:hypothetical protein [Bacteroidales bacterium]MCF8344059.1 hypothetical protein [Bacteroidales bacterium]MCF8352314.1 hypothetical protein [Bacteroidales bacterium]MCF8374831.1 hypothetical protein [Bacteroidales bacterium]MCF8399765.1 hypothetical protein [Bacteroidales bacterium]